ncbi:MAG: hypothetical protein Q9173_005712, partial [Seirophora scorigena]
DYTTHEFCPGLSTSVLSQLEARWPNSRSRTELHTLKAKWIGHLYINLLLGSNVPDSARLDVPNEEGKFLTVNVHGRLEARHEPTTTSWSTAATEPPLPNAQYQSYPMIINHLNRPCVLHAPWWDTIAGPKPGHPYPLTQDEYKKRKRLREKALRDLEQYGSPNWLAREPDSWDLLDNSEEMACHHAFAPQSLRHSAMNETGTQDLKGFSSSELQIIQFVRHPKIVERKAFYYSNGDREDRLRFSQVLLVANTTTIIIANGPRSKASQIDQQGFPRTMRVLSQQTGRPPTHDIRSVGRILSLAGQAIADELPQNSDGELIDEIVVAAPDKPPARI